MQGRVRRVVLYAKSHQKSHVQTGLSASDRLVITEQTNKRGGAYDSYICLRRGKWRPNNTRCADKHEPEMGAVILRTTFFYS